MITLLAKLNTMLALEISKILWLCALLLGLIGATLAVVSIVRSKKRQNPKCEQQVEQQDILMQEQEYLEANERGEIVMSRNVIYSVGIDGQIKSGKYQMKNADGATDKFNVRVNGLVREYANGDELTLTDGDTLSPVSGSVVISPLGE